MSLTKVQFLTTCSVRGGGLYAAGEVAGFDAKAAQELVSRGWATLYPPPAAEPLPVASVAIDPEPSDPAVAPADEPSDGEEPAEDRPSGESADEAAADPASADETPADETTEAATAGPDASAADVTTRGRRKRGGQA